MFCSWGSVLSSGPPTPQSTPVYRRLPPHAPPELADRKSFSGSRFSASGWSQELNIFWRSFSVSWQLQNFWSIGQNPRLEWVEGVKNCSISRLTEVRPSAVIIPPQHSARSDLILKYWNNVRGKGWEHLQWEGRLEPDWQCADSLLLPNKVARIFLSLKRELTTESRNYQTA